MKSLSGRAALIAALAPVASGLAQPIVVVNPSFEDPALSANGFTLAAPPGWTGGAGGTVGVFYPTVAAWGYIAPLGNQVLYMNVGSAEQTLAEGVRAGVGYTLLVDVVHRPGFYGGDYLVQLYAGETLVAQDDGRLASSIPVGEYRVVALSYRAPAGDPLIGQPLRIHLAGPTQTNFDDVRVTTCRPDLDGDGTLTFFDFLAFLNTFAVGDPLADFTGDGVLDFFDFLQFQNEFAAGCA